MGSTPDGPPALDSSGEAGAMTAAAFLGCLPLFAGLPQGDLDQLCSMVEDLRLAAGQELMVEGEPGDAMYVIAEGEFEVLKGSRDRQVILARRGPGDFIGEMSLLEQSPRSATVRALVDSRVFRIGQEAFRRLLIASPNASAAILQTVGQRLRGTESLMVQREKMAALGTLAAGLAHELNNPAAAVRSAAGQLRGLLESWQEAQAAFYALDLDEGRLDTAWRLQEECIAGLAQPGSLAPLVYAEREEALLAWLEELGVEDAWQLAPVLVSAGWQLGNLRQALAAFDSTQLPAVVCWLAVTSAVYDLVEDVNRGAARISELVGAVKRYSYLDQAPVQHVDVHDGLEDTLIILRHRLKQGVEVVRDFAPDLPRIEVRAGELNQVWTNLVDNALDAMLDAGPGGMLLLRTYAQPGKVVVEIIDDGPGIPPEIEPRIFEPFFTTKPVGTGAGLGLHVVHNIVVLEHGGQIQVESRPGYTCFRVSLPHTLPEPLAGAAPQRGGGKAPESHHGGTESTENR
jgi:signal transduction histidine kinase